jgi:acetylornithine deacetylase
MTDLSLHPPIRPERLADLLRRLIDIYSPSGKEHELLEYLSDTLRSRGLPVIRQSVDEDRYNLLVLPAEADVQVAFVGHVDTVGAYDLDRYEYSQDGDRIYGLGAADMKSGCAALLEAFLTVWSSNPGRLPAALALLVGEEEENDGVKKLVEEYHFPWVVLAEPTDLAPCLCHYGYIETQLTTRGRRRHASLAGRGANPVERMLHLLLAVTRYFIDDRGEVVYNIRDLISPQAGFAVPEWCEAWIDIHTPPHAPVGDVCIDLEETVEANRKSEPPLDAKIRFHTIIGGYELPEKGPVVRGLKSVFADRNLTWNPKPFPSHSDANLLWASGMKPILLGPGQLEKAHAPDESVLFSQVEAAAGLYRDLMLKFVT